MKVIFGLIFFSYFLILGVNSYPNGAPVEACGNVTDIVPNHNSSALSDGVPFSVNLTDFEEDVYIPERMYYLYLQSDNNTGYSFRGFMIQARTVADDSPAGYFIYNGTEYQLQCDNDTAATHKNNTDKDSVVLIWMAPPAGTGAIRFRYAFVLNYSTYWANLDTKSINEGCTYINGTCQCAPGYLSDTDNITCRAIALCEGYNDCHQICINTSIDGSYYCTCDAGFELAADNRMCTALINCTMSPNCSDGCAVINGTETCFCTPGYQLDMDSITCIDIDECNNTSPCDHTCTNTNGSFTCSCNNGYELDDNGRSCNDIDECTNNPCEHNCTNTDGSFMCSCYHDGYELDENGINCTDINECEEELYDCPDDMMCNNVVGNYYTCDCPDGTMDNGTDCVSIPSGTDESSDDDDGVSTGVVVGIVVGVLVGVIVVTIIIIGIYFWLSSKKGVVKKVKIAPGHGGSDNQKLTKE